MDILWWNMLVVTIATLMVGVIEKLVKGWMEALREHAE